MDLSFDSILQLHGSGLLSDRDNVAVIYGMDENSSTDAMDILVGKAENNAEVHFTVAHSLNAIFNGLHKGMTVFVSNMDELFKTDMIHSIIRQFMSHNTNKSGSRLILSVNDEAVLHDESLSYQQIWIAMSDRRHCLHLRHKFRFLIVCEGGKTEPNYFRALLKYHSSSSIIDLEIYGLGMSTSSLVDGTKRLRDKLEASEGRPFDRIWVVFDEDGNPGFNEAIRRCQRYGFAAAWTNEAFELWYYLHFEFLDAGIGRHDYIEKLNAILQKKTQNPRYHYKKNDKNFYELLVKYGNEEFARKCAVRLRSRYSGTDFTKYKPCTTVDRLVEELEHPEKCFDFLPAE